MIKNMPGAPTDPETIKNKTKRKTYFRNHKNMFIAKKTGDHKNK